MVDLRIKQLDHSRRLHRLRLLREYKQSEFDIRLCLHLWQRCHIMEVEASRVHNPLYHRGRLYSNFRCSEGSHLASTTVSRLLGGETNQPSSTENLLWLSECNIVYHTKTKHIEVQFHHIRELITKNKLKVRRINTEVNITDYLTNPLPKQRFEALRTMMGLRQATEQKRAEHTTNEG